jgi:exopolyphosphatase/guanosine-5'-triphosphate,3'-diphosphate pyrophosphatase
LSYIYMNSQYAFLNSLSYEQRISLDWIRIAWYSCHQNLSERDEMGGARNIYVPKIGLSDGIVKRCIMVKYNDKLGI